METTTVMSVNGLHRGFGRSQVLRGVDLAVGRREIVGLLGPNGAGKSTLVACLVGLLKPTRGRVRIAGRDPARDRRAVTRLLGVQLQGGTFHDALSVRELLRLFGSAHRHPWPAEDLMARVGLIDQAATRYGNLSGGQQQRLALAVAMIGRPPLLVLDELTTGLDPQARRRIWQLIDELRESGTSILLVSHSMEEVERLCDRIALLVDGRIEAHGTVAAVIARARQEDNTATTLDDAFLALSGQSVEKEEADW